VRGEIEHKFSLVVKRLCRGNAAGDYCGVDSRQAANGNGEQEKKNAETEGENELVIEQRESVEKGDTDGTDSVPKYQGQQAAGNADDGAFHQ
jgi:hypothetical protein